MGSSWAELEGAMSWQNSRTAVDSMQSQLQRPALHIQLSASLVLSPEAAELPPHPRQTEMHSRVSTDQCLIQDEDKGCAQSLSYLVCKHRGPLT